MKQMRLRDILYAIQSPRSLERQEVWIDPGDCLGEMAEAIHLLPGVLPITSGNDRIWRGLWVTVERESWWST